MKGLGVSLAYRCKYVAVAFFATICFGCGPQKTDYEKIAARLTDKTAIKLEKQKNIFLFGTGGQMMDDIQMMAMSFVIYHEVTLEEARELLVSTVDEYVSDINGNEEIRPFLHEYPFTAKNVEIRMFFYDPRGRDLPIDKICVIAAIEGKLDYCSRGSNEYRFNTLHEETYEEACACLKNSKPKYGNE